MATRVLKFSLAGLGIAAMAGAALWAIDYFPYQKSPEYQARIEAEKIKKEYAEDPYGGETPEETLALFIDALKKGDTDLAAKYFVMDKQKEWREDLAKIKEKKLLGDMVRDLEREKEKKILTDNQNIFYIYNDNNILALSITFTKSLSGKWKIQDL